MVEDIHIYAEYDCDNGIGKESDQIACYGIFQDLRELKVMWHILSYWRFIMTIKMAICLTKIFLSIIRLMNLMFSVVQYVRFRRIY